MVCLEGVNIFSVFLEHAWVGARSHRSASNEKASPYPRTEMRLLVPHSPPRTQHSSSSPKCTRRTILHVKWSNKRYQMPGLHSRSLDLPRVELQNDIQFSILLHHRITHSLCSLLNFELQTFVHFANPILKAEEWLANTFARGPTSP